jgi:hypothetical protein
MSHEHTQSLRVEGTAKSWHGWETQIEADKARDLHAVMAAVGLENVRAIPLVGIDAENGGNPLPTGKVGIYDSRGVCLGAHEADSYKVHQPEDTLKPYWEIIEADGRFRFDFGARLRDGKVWVMNFALEESEDIVSEKHDFYLGVSSSFDGTRATTCDGSTVRKVCMNTVRLSDSLSNTVKTRFRHRRELPSSEKFQAQVENALRQRDEYKSFAEMLSQYKMTKDAAIAFLKESIFKPEIKKVTSSDGKTTIDVLTEPNTRTSNRIDAMIKSFETTQDEIGSKVTAWTTWNAITRFADHESGIRQTEERKAAGLNDNQMRYESNLYGSSDSFKQEQMKRIGQLVAAA